MKKLFDKRSKVLFVAGLLGTLYGIYLISYFVGINNGSGDTAEQIGGALATALVMPHMILVLLAIIFNWLGFFLRKAGFALTAAILYSVSAVVFILYAIFVVPMIVLGFVGYSKQKKINK